MTAMNGCHFFDGKINLNQVFDNQGGEVWKRKQKNFLVRPIRLELKY